VTATELRHAGLAAGIFAPTFTAATRYAQPTLPWLTGPFRDYFRQQLFDLRLDRWRVRWECRDFARAFAHYAQLAHALTPGGDAASDCLAVGELWYHPRNDAAVGHAINAAVVADALIFLEPQTGQCVNLTSAELSSAYFLRW
jgi:hypothetical protein